LNYDVSSAEVYKAHTGFVIFE